MVFSLIEKGLCIYWSSIGVAIGWKYRLFSRNMTAICLCATGVAVLANQSWIFWSGCGWQLL